MARFKGGVDANVPTSGANDVKLTAAPPQDRSPSEILQKLISRGRIPHLVMDFPREDRDTGEPLQKVMLRVLTIGEEDSALAAGRRYAAAKLQQKTSEEQPEDLAHNACIAEILAIAARDPDDPSKPFFPYGVMDIREYCTSEEIATLARAYAALREESGPHLREMSEEELEAYVRVVAEATLQRPFSYLSRGKLETFAEYCVTSLVAARLLLASPTPTPSSPSA